MNDQRPLTFFHAPNSRSSGVLARARDAELAAAQA